MYKCTWTWHILVLEKRMKLKRFLLLNFKGRFNNFGHKDEVKVVF